MRRVLVLAVIVGFAVWRSRQLDASDRQNGFGAYAPVMPVTTDPGIR